MPKCACAPITPCAPSTPNSAPITPPCTVYPRPVHRLPHHGVNGARRAPFTPTYAPFTPYHHHHHHHHHKRLKAICKSIRYEDHQSICSLLIAKDRDDLLHKYMIRILKINPFETEFKDVHFDWFHEALFCGATKVVFYLFHYHREMLENVVFHAPNKDNNKRREIFSYFDLVLMSPHLTMSQRQIYFDEILCRVPYGLKLFHHTPKDIVKFCSLQLVKFVTANMSPIDFVRRCIQDNMK